MPSFFSRPPRRPPRRRGFIFSRISAIFSVQVTETLTVGETRAVSFLVLKPQVTEAVTLGEAVTVSSTTLSVTVTETVTVAETLSLPGLRLRLTITEPLTLTDPITMSKTILTLAVVDPLTVGESVTILLPFLRRTVTDSLTVGEVVATRGFLRFVQVTDALTIGEVRAVNAGLRTVQVSDGLTVEDTPTLRGVQLLIQVTEPLTLEESVAFVSLAFIPVPPTPRPPEPRHWMDQLILSLQRREDTYNVPIARWDATTATLMTGIDDDSVHERWDDAVVGADQVRLGYRLASSQVRAQASVRLAVTQPRVTTHTLAGLLGLTLGQVSSDQQPFLPLGYRHRLTLAPPTQLPSISAQIGHQQNLYTIYPGFKGEQCTLRNNGPYLSLSCGMVGSGTHQDATATTRLDTTVITTGVPPDAHRLTDELGGLWYLFPDGHGGWILDTVPPAGSVVSVGLGLELMTVDGTRTRVGVASWGVIVTTPLAVEAQHTVEAFALRDSTGVTWYFWVEDGMLTLDAVPPAPTPAVLQDEPWLRWGTSRLYLADVTEAPLHLSDLVQGSSNLGSEAIDISTRVLSVALEATNTLLTQDAYRVGGGDVRSNFHASRQSLTLTLALQVDPVTEAVDLLRYLNQRHLAFEWQYVGDVMDTVTIGLPGAATLPAYHQITDSLGSTWYLVVGLGGQVGVSPTAPLDVGLVAGTGLVLLGLDGWSTRLGVSPFGEIALTRLTFVGVPASVEVVALRTTLGQGWYLWVDAMGGLAVAPNPPSPSVLLTAGTSLIAFHQVLDSASTTWYLTIDRLGEVVCSTVQPPGMGLNTGLGLELRALDGWRYRLGVDPFGAVTLTQTVFLGLATHVVEVIQLLDPDGLPWYLWMDAQGGYVVSRQHPSVSPDPSAPTPWRQGFTVLIPHMQYRALQRTQQQQFDVLELTGTVLEDLPDEPITVAVYNRQPGYLQPA